LWNAVEIAETRKNSIVGREYVIAIPAELDEENRKKLTVEFAKHICDKYKVVANVAIHKPGKRNDDRNFHAHIMTSTREITSEGFGAKTRVLDCKNTSEIEISGLRNTWAEMGNRYLEVARSERRMDARSFADRGIDRVPEIHLGPAASEMERRGIETSLGNWNRKIREYNEAIQEQDALVAETEKLRVEVEAAFKAQAPKVSAEVQSVRFDIEPAAPMAATRLTSEPWTVAEMSEVWPDVQAPVSAEARGVRFITTPEPDVETLMVAPMGATMTPERAERGSSVGNAAAAVTKVTPIGRAISAPPKPDIKATVSATVAPMSGKVGRLTSEPGKVPEPRVAAEAPLVVPITVEVSSLVAEKERLEAEIIKDQKRKYEQLIAAIEKRNNHNAKEPIKPLIAFGKKKVAYKKAYSDWDYEHFELQEAVKTCVKAAGGDWKMPDHGEAEIRRRLTPDYARDEAARRIEAAEQAKAEKAKAQAKVEKERLEAEALAKVKDTFRLGDEVVFSNEKNSFQAKILSYGEKTNKIRIEFEDGKKYDLKALGWRMEAVPEPKGRSLNEEHDEMAERDRRIVELDNKLNNPPYWIGSAGYPIREAAADVRELLKLESMRLYDESEGQISHNEALEKAIERHPVLVGVQERLERGRGMGR
jgi:hypothetical protein